MPLVAVGKEPKTRLALFVRVDRSSGLTGYFHIVGRVKALAVDMKTFEHCQEANGQLIQDLQVRVQGDNSSSAVYAWKYGYDTPGFVDRFDAGRMAKTLDKVDKRMGKIAAEHGSEVDSWTYFYRFARAVGCERIMFFTADRSPSMGLPDEIDWSPCDSEGLSTLRRIHAVAIQRFGKKADVG
jgi:hypothetical protein